MSKKPTRRTRRRSRVSSLHTYVIVAPDHTTKKPRILADPEKLKHEPLYTGGLEKARTYTDRSGLHKFLKRHPELRKSHKMLRVA